MQFKVVYVVVAGPDSIYLEQTYASIWSLKHYNPDANVTLVMDNRTQNIYEDRNYTELMSIVEDVISIPFEEEIDNHTRSRWLKTNLRNLIKGDYLYLDTDTIIAGDISALTNFTGFIGAIPDGHRHINQTPIYPFVLKWMNKYFNNTRVIPNINYYNSGVMVVKDLPTNYIFYNLWHKNWEKSKEQGFKFDQLSLFATDNELQGLISPLPDIYNYQVSESVKFIYSSKILHFFNGEDLGSLHPFFNKIWLQDIKLHKKIPNKLKEDILNCKDLFNIHSKFISGNNIDVWNSHCTKLLLNIRTHKCLYLFFDSIARGINFIIRILKKFNKI